MATPETPVTTLPGVIDVPDRDVVRDDFTRDFRFWGPAGTDTQEGTLPYIDGSVFADGVQPLWAAAKTAGNNLVLRLAQGDALEEWAVQSGLDPRQPATGASGFVTAQTASGGSTILQGDEIRDDATKAIRYTCSQTKLYLNGDPIPITATDTGIGTNQPAGAVLTWTAQRPGCELHANVLADINGDGLTGGRAAEEDSELLTRILDAKSNPPAYGNDADVQRRASRTGGVPVQRAFTYPCVLGPGTTGVVLTLRPLALGGSRIPNAVQLTQVETAIKTGLPPDFGLFVCTLQASSTDVHLQADWADSATGWADITPWPPADVASWVYVSAVTSPTVFTLARSAGYVGFAQPVFGQTLGLYSAATQTFARKKILSFTGTGPWVVTCDASAGASDTAFAPAVNDPVSPWSDSLDLIVPTILAHFDSLGPGEQFSSFFDLGTRQRRSPPVSGLSYPASLTTRFQAAIENASAIQNAEVILPSLPHAPPIGTPGVTSYIIQLGRLAVYRLSV
jgi:hypothetical protein